MPKVRTKHRAQQMVPEERKRLLLMLAVQEFSEKGIDAAKHADIAKAAKVSVPTVFSYFPSRQALVEEVLGAVERFMLENIVEPSMEPESKMERLLVSARVLQDALEKHPAYTKVWLMWSTHFAPDMQALYLKFEKKLLINISELLFRDDRQTLTAQEQTDKARMLLGISAMLAQMVFHGAKRARQEAFVESVIDTFKI